LCRYADGKRFPPETVAQTADGQKMERVAAAIFKTRLCPVEGLIEAQCIAEMFKLSFAEHF